MNIESLNILAALVGILSGALQIFIILKTFNKENTSGNNIIINLNQQSEIFINNPSTATTYNSSNENIKILILIASIFLFGLFYFVFLEFVFVATVVIYIPFSIIQTRNFLLILKDYNFKLKKSHLIKFVSEKIFLLLIILSIAYIPFDMKQFVTPILPPDGTFGQLSTIIGWLISIFLYLLEHLILYDYHAFYYVFRAAGMVMLIILIGLSTRSKAVVNYFDENKNRNLLRYFLTLIFLHSHITYPYVERLLDFLGS